MLSGKYEPAHNCPECGQFTTGAHSEGGCRWALCPECYRRMIEQQRNQLDQELSKYDNEPDPPGGYGFDPETRTGSQEDIDGWE